MFLSFFFFLLILLDVLLITVLLVIIVLLVIFCTIFVRYFLVLFALFFNQDLILEILRVDLFLNLNWNLWRFNLSITLFFLLLQFFLNHITLFLMILSLELLHLVFISFPVISCLVQIWFLFLILQIFPVFGNQFCQFWQGQSGELFRKRWLLVLEINNVSSQRLLWWFGFIDSSLSVFSIIMFWLLRLVVFTLWRFIGFLDQFCFMNVGLPVVWYKRKSTIFVEVKTVLWQGVEELRASKGKFWHLLHYKNKYNGFLALIAVLAGVCYLLDYHASHLVVLLVLRHGISVWAGLNQL